MRRKPKQKTDSAPRLPYALSKEIGTDRNLGLGGAKRGVSMFHVSNRKAARKAARRAKKAHTAKPNPRAGPSDRQLPVVGQKRASTSLNAEVTAAH